MQDTQETWWKQFLYAWRSIGECSSIDIEIESAVYNKEYLDNSDKVPESISSSFKKYIYRPDSRTYVTKVKNTNGGEISAFVATSNGKTSRGPRWRRPRRRSRSGKGAMDANLNMVLEQVGRDKNIDKSVLVSALEQAILTAAKRTFGMNREMEAKYNPETGIVDLFIKLQILA